ncbi:hypothetical protein LEP1GSC086_3343 [Leptospira weilii str. LNT 1234]|nr:hypothetical protein LEP1GSC086_3343 [Leptospira weilii str. LNT 1234]
MIKLILIYRDRIWSFFINRYSSYRLHDFPTIREEIPPPIFYHPVQSPGSFAFLLEEFFVKGFFPHTNSFGKIRIGIW